MVQFLENGKGLGPGFGGRGGVAVGMVGVAETGVDAGLVVAVAMGAELDEGLPAAGYGLVVVAEVGVHLGDEGEHVMRIGLAAEVGKLTEQVECVGQVAVGVVVLLPLGGNLIHPNGPGGSGTCCGTRQAAMRVRPSRRRRPARWPTVASSSGAPATAAVTASRCGCSTASAQRAVSR